MKNIRHIFSSIMIMLIIILVLGLSCSSSTTITEESTYSALDDFSTTNGNPNGVWSYGWMPDDLNSFNLYSWNLTDQWGMADTNGNTPTIWKNTTGGTSYGVPDGWLSIHPGEGTISGLGTPEHSVLRWTAPIEGTIDITGQFLTGDSGTMTVAVRQNNTILWHATDSGMFDLTENVSIGDTIDFAVYGAYLFGNTPISATISYD